MPTCAIALSSDGIYFAVALGDGSIRICKSGSREVVSSRSLPGQSGSSSKALAFANDDKILVSSDWLVQDHLGAPGGIARVTFWGVPSGNPKEVFANVGGQALAVSADEQQLAASSGGPINLFDLQSGKVRRNVLNSGHERITCLSFSTDAKALVAAGSDGWSTWNVVTGQLRANVKIDSPSMVFDATFSSDGTTVVLVGDKDDCIRYFSADTGTEQKQVPWEKGYRQLCISGDHRRMASCGHSEPGVMVWDVDTGRKLTTFGALNHYSHVAISADGKVLVGARADSRGVDGIDTWHYDIDQ
jgi:WD40 repeat protein